jgi:hypothetical protein
VSRHRLALRSFPRNWRRRYGEELLTTLEETASERSPLQTSIDIVRAGATERLRQLGARRWVVIGLAPLILLAAVAVPLGLQLTTASTTHPTHGANTNSPIALTLPGFVVQPAVGNSTGTLSSPSPLTLRRVGAPLPFAKFGNPAVAKLGNCEGPPQGLWYVITAGNGDEYWFATSGAPPGVFSSGATMVLLCS